MLRDTVSQSARNADARALLNLFYEKRPRGSGQGIWEIGHDADALGMDRDRLIEAADRLTRLGYCKKAGMFAYSITPKGIDASESPEQLNATLPLLRYDPAQMGSSKESSGPASPPRLVVPRAEAREKLDRQLTAGKTIELSRVPTHQVDEKVSSAYTWSDVTTHLLRVLFDTDEERERFAAATSLGIRLGDDPASRLGNANDMLSVRIRRLESVLARLDLFPEPAAMQQPAPKLVGDGRSVFVVHGHDLAAKQETARMIEKLRLTAVILDEQANRGRTIIEKFEDHARECVYAVVLLTADDLGRAKIATEDEPRARQNVIFEMGYFMARLGRGHVCALVAHGLKQPSDIHGLGWVELDAAGAWKAKVAKEMKDAGLPVDMNDLF